MIWVSLLFLRLRKLYSLLPGGVFEARGCRIPKLFHHLLARQCRHSTIQPFHFFTLHVSASLCTGTSLWGEFLRREGTPPGLKPTVALSSSQYAEAFSNKLEFSLMRQFHSQCNAMQCHIFLLNCFSKSIVKFETGYWCYLVYGVLMRFVKCKTLYFNGVGWFQGNALNCEMIPVHNFDWKSSLIERCQLYKDQTLLWFPHIFPHIYVHDSAAGEDAVDRSTQLICISDLYVLYITYMSTDKYKRHSRAIC